MIGEPGASSAPSSDELIREQAAAAPAASALPAEDAAVSTTPLHWPICNPSTTLKVLQKLDEADCPKGKDGKGKPLAKSYVSWEKCNDGQRNKILSYFSSLTPEVKTRVAAEATAVADVAAEGDSSRAEITNKDDRARIGMYYNNCYVCFEQFFAANTTLLENLRSSYVYAA
jgi:hypothetical protein